MRTVYLRALTYVDEGYERAMTWDELSTFAVYRNDHAHNDRPIHVYDVDDEGGTAQEYFHYAVNEALRFANWAEADLVVEVPYSKSLIPYRKEA